MGWYERELPEFDGWTRVPSVRPGGTTHFYNHKTDNVTVVWHRGKRQWSIVDLAVQNLAYRNWTPDDRRKKHWTEHGIIRFFDYVTDAVKWYESDRQQVTENGLD